MVAEAVLLRGRHDMRQTTTAAAVVGEVRQMPDGRASVLQALNAPAAGDSSAWTTEGVHTVQKTTSMVILDGGKVFWDHSANKAHFKTVNDRDFYLGTAVGDAAAADTTMAVNINVEAKYLIDVSSSPTDSVVVLTTAAAASVNNRGGSSNMLFSTDAEAQKTDILSKDGWAVGANAIVEGAIEVIDNGDDAALDLNIGIANATHATDADSITESCFIHIDGNVLNILAESDDGTTEVTATDTTVDYVVGTRFEFWMDTRNPADIQIYIDGVLVLPSSVFKLDAATGPLKLLAHMEKTSNNTPAELDIEWLRCRISEQ